MHLHFSIYLFLDLDASLKKRNYCLMLFSGFPFHGVFFRMEFSPNVMYFCVSKDLFFGNLKKTEYNKIKNRYS